MGCDFQISGRLPDPTVRKKCLDFLRVFNSMIPQVSPLTYKNLKKASKELATIHHTGTEITAFNDPIYAKTPLIRKDRYPTFGKMDNFTAEYGSCSTTARWSADCFEGVMINGIPIIFDVPAGGVICSLHRKPARNANNEEVMDWNWPDWLLFSKERGPCDQIVVYPACHSRFSSGDPFVFVMAELLKLRFIPDLKIEADYDVDYYHTLLKIVGYLQLFSRCSEELLPKLAVEAALEAGMMYHWNSEAKLRIFERNEQRKKQL